MSNELIINISQAVLCMVLAMLILAGISLIVIDAKDLCDRPSIWTSIDTGMTTRQNVDCKAIASALQNYADSDPGHVTFASSGVLADVIDSAYRYKLECEK
ncbi:MAG: hypothetical protein ACREVA_00025 [Burkholderiales bacterium]